MPVIFQMTCAAADRESAERFITEENKRFEDQVLGARDKALARERNRKSSPGSSRPWVLCKPLRVRSRLDALAALSDRAGALEWV